MYEQQGLYCIYLHDYICICIYVTNVPVGFVSSNLTQKNIDNVVKSPIDNKEKKTRINERKITAAYQQE